MEGSRNEVAAQSEQCEEVIDFWCDTEAKTRTELTASSTVLNVEAKPMKPDFLTLQKLLQPQRDNVLCQERSESVGEPQCCSDYDRYGILV